MHLALELDQSKQVSADPKQDLQLALTVLRKRIDEFGVAEPLIQQVGDERIVVELAGINDPARAKAIVQRSAFLEFKITNETRALEKALAGDGPGASQPWASRPRARRLSHRQCSSCLAAIRPRRRDPRYCQSEDTAAAARRKTRRAPTLPRWSAAYSAV